MLGARLTSAGRPFRLPAQAQSGRSSGVEHNLAKVGVEGSNPFARSSAAMLNGMRKRWSAWAVTFYHCQDEVSDARLVRCRFVLMWRAKETRDDRTG